MVGTAHATDWLDYRTGCAGTTGTRGDEGRPSSSSRARPEPPARRPSGVLTVSTPTGRGLTTRSRTTARSPAAASRAAATRTPSRSSRPRPRPMRVNPVTGEPDLVWTPHRLPRPRNAVHLVPGPAGRHRHAEPRAEAGALRPGHGQPRDRLHTDHAGRRGLPGRLPLLRGRSRGRHRTDDLQHLGRGHERERPHPGRCRPARPGREAFPTRARAPSGTSPASPGLRISVTSRSAPLRFETRNISVRRGAATSTNVRAALRGPAGAAPNDFEQPGATLGRPASETSTTTG